MGSVTTFHFLGLIVDSLKPYCQSSLFAKAKEKQVLDFQFHQLRDWALDKHNKVDDSPYGGGAGMVFLPEVVCRAVRELVDAHGIDRVLLTSPRGAVLSPQMGKRLADCRSILILCGRYEGVDQRAIDAVVDEEVSVGDYVLTGGELAAACIVDAVSRYIPGVVGKSASVSEDSFEDGLLEHPHYTRPEVFEGVSVPAVLLSGNHKEIEKWRQEQSFEITEERRPDLLVTKKG